jgi:hypothetical protein
LCKARPSVNGDRSVAVKANANGHFIAETIPNVRNYKVAMGQQGYAGRLSEINPDCVNNNSGGVPHNNGGLSDPTRYIYRRLLRFGFLTTAESKLESGTNI